MSAPAAAAAKKAVKFTTNFRLAGLNYLDALTVQTTALRNVRWWGGARGAGRAACGVSSPRLCVVLVSCQGGWVHVMHGSWAMGRTHERGGWPGALHG